MIELSTIGLYSFLQKVSKYKEFTTQMVFCINLYSYDY